MASDVTVNTGGSSFALRDHGGEVGGPLILLPLLAHTGRAEPLAMHLSLEAMVTMSSRCDCRTCQSISKRTFARSIDSWIRLERRAVPVRSVKSSPARPLPIEQARRLPGPSASSDLTLSVTCCHDESHSFHHFFTRFCCPYGISSCVIHAIEVRQADNRVEGSSRVDESRW